MKRLTVIALALALNAGTALNAGCAGRYYWHSHTHYGYAAYPTAPAQVVVTQPPPPVPMTTELRPPQPSASSTWVEGHWTYNGMWAWVDGTWVTGYAGWVWTAPAIVIVDGYYVLHRGYFRQPAYQPAPAYTHPHRIQISVGAQVVASNHHAPRYQVPTPPRASDAQATIDQPRVLQVPGAVVRTPPAPTATVTPPVLAPAPTNTDAGPVPERPVLRAPGATVIQHPIGPQAPIVAAPISPMNPAQPPPLLSNVAPVVERPAPPAVIPDKVPGRISTPTPVPVGPPSAPPVVLAPTKAPSHDTVAPTNPARPPAHVAPSGNATLAPRRVQPGPNVNQAAEQPDHRRSPNLDAMRAQPDRSRDNRRDRGTTDAAPTTTPPAATSTQARGKPASAATVLPSGGATRSAGRGRKDPDAKPTDKPAAAITCTLGASEAPRGGQLDLHGEGFGATPVVRIGGKVTRILRRNATDIRVQIPRDSNGGSVTVQAGATTGECGSLTIIGTDR